jgi:hypothetical protein
VPSSETFKFMTTYNDLVDEIAVLYTRHAPPSAFCPSPLVVPGGWIPSVVDTTTSATPGKQPVIVAVGANYATGPGKLPAVACARRRTSPPWVEEDLGRWRKRIMTLLVACDAGRVKGHWNGLLPFDPDQTYHLNATNRLQGAHLVMANVCPWITTKDWATIRDASLEDMFTALSGSGMGSGSWSYFRDLKKVVGRDVVWVGHGNAEIFGLFRLICWQLGIREWFFDSNLSRPSLMMCPTSRSTVGPRKKKP